MKGLKIDDQLTAIRSFIIEGRYTSFRQMFKYVNKTKLAGILHITPSRFLECVKFPEYFRLMEVQRMAEILNIPTLHLLQVFLRYEARGVTQKSKNATN